VKEHIQDIVHKQAAQITLNNGKVLRDVIESSDLVGIVLETTVVDRSGGTMQARIIPWAAIQDVAILSEYHSDPRDALNDHRTFPVPLFHDYDTEYHKGWNSGVSASEDGGPCHVCATLSS
jgi:hypothetical protein